MTIRMSPKGTAKIKNDEGFRSFVYDDHHKVYPKVALKPGQTPRGYATTGYGFNVGRIDWWKHPLAKEALEGKMTEKRADEILEVKLLDFCRHLEGLVVDSVEALMNQDMRDEFCNFAFNVGIGNVSKSTCLRVLNAVKEPGDFVAVGKQMLRWVHDSEGNELAALVERRGANAAPFLKPTVDKR